MASRTKIFNLFLTLVLGGGLLIGALIKPGPWYDALVKPPFNPPNWVFAPVWTLLYIVIAFTGYRTWIRDKKGVSMSLWWTQLLLNFLWTPVFFGTHSVGMALIVITFLVANVAAYIFSVRKNDRLSAVLFLPYLAWLSFAWVLNAAIRVLNELP